jgi:hypothetical protein
LPVPPQLAISSSKFADRTVAIHCPDIIRETFEHQRADGGLDVFFGFSLYHTMQNSGAFENGYPPESTTCWLDGWHWMKRYTEGVFKSKWPDMESRWSCRGTILEAARAGHKLNVLRVVSENGGCQC